MTCGVSLYGKVIEGAGEENAEENVWACDVTAGRRKANNERHVL